MPSRRSALRALVTTLSFTAAGCAGNESEGDAPPTSQQRANETVPTQSPVDTETRTSPTEGSETATETRTRTDTPSDRRQNPLTSCPTPITWETQAWPSFSYDERNIGVHPTTSGPVDDVGVEWEFDAGSEVQTSPAVSDGTVYFSSVNGKSGVVSAVSAQSGEEVWTFSTAIEDGTFENSVVDADSMESSPAVTAGTVVVGGGNVERVYEDGELVDRDRHYHVYGLNAETGTERWRYETVGYPHRSDPTIVGNTVYIGCREGFLYAIDLRDGSERWRVRIDDGQMIGATPAVSDCTVFVGSHSGGIHALDARTGARTWRYEAEKSASASPAVHDGTVYVGLDGGGPLLALSASDGAMRWRAEIGGTVQSSPAVYDTTVYIGTYGVEGFRAFDSETGEPAWSADIGRTWGSPAIADGIVYIGSLAGRVYAFEAESGDELWTVDIGDLIKSSPAVVDGSLYIGSHNGRVYALSE